MTSTFLSLCVCGVCVCVCVCVVYVCAALGIQEIINAVRYDEDRCLQVQLDVFDEELSADADALDELSRESVDVSRPEDIFAALYKKVRLIYFLINLFN